jgi:N6-L-threonylcarbamoyladenine synthase
LKNPVILAIESSCDETAAAVLTGDTVRSNVIATQEIHARYGGVVPELASRAHQSHIVPVVDEALRTAGVKMDDLDIVACTIGPGLMGSLLVGISFAKSISLALGKPFIGVNHMQAHVLAHFIRDNPDQRMPAFPFLCLTVSGGHTQIVRVNGPLEMQIIGETADDAAGEAFDKAAKLFGLPYPGGPELDKIAAGGNAGRFRFTRPQVPGLNFSFSGLKTSLLYFVKEQERLNPDFVRCELPDLCASFQHAIVTYLVHVLKKAAHETGITEIALAGGVSANSELRRQITDAAKSENWNLYIPPLSYCTDNAAMIGIAALHMHAAGMSSPLSERPQTRAPAG